MDKLKILGLSNIVISIISLIFVFLPSFPIKSISDMFIINLVFSILFLFAILKFKPAGFITGAFICYSLLNILFFYSVVEVFFDRSRDLLLGYQFVVLYYSSIPIIIFGSFIGFILIKIKKSKHKK